MHEVSPGVFIFDLGQNFAGWVRLRVQGPRGTTVRMRMGERLYPDGTLNPMTAVAGQIKGLKEDGTPRGGPGAPEIAWQSNSYTLRGGEPEEYTPRFTFHGFQYVEATVEPSMPSAGPPQITGLVLHSDTPLTSTFECSDPMVNRLFKNVVWTQRANFVDLPTD